jgi:hypothetical protein
MWGYSLLTHILVRVMFPQLILQTEHIKLVKKSYPEVGAVVGDAHDLPWPE